MLTDAHGIHWHLCVRLKPQEWGVDLDACQAYHIDINDILRKEEIESTKNNPLVKIELNTGEVIC